MTPLSDIRLARAGDLLALDRVLIRLQDKLRGIAHQKLGRELRTFLRTSDLLQSAYLDVLRGLQSFEGEDEDKFVGWVLRIIERNAADRRRFFLAEKRKTSLLGTTLRHDAEAHLAATDPEPLSSLGASDELHLVGRALLSLPEDQRSILKWKLLEGESHETIAERLNKSELATRSLLLRARAALLLAIDRLRSTR